MRFGHGTCQHLEATHLQRLNTKPIIEHFVPVNSIRMNAVISRNSFPPRVYKVLVFDFQNIYTTFYMHLEQKNNIGLHVFVRCLFSCSTTLAYNGEQQKKHNNIILK